MGSFPVDIDLRIDPRSAIKAYETFTKEAKALMAQVTAGVEGADKKLMKLQEDFGRNMISTSTRAGRAVESSIKSLERQAEVAGKTRSEALLIRQEKWIKMLGEDEAAIKRVTVAFQKLIKVEEEQEKKGGHGSVGNLIFRGTKDIFEGRGTYALMDFITAGTKMSGGGAAGGAAGAGGLASLSATTLALGGLTAGFLAVEAAGAAAAKSLGEYGTEIRDVELRTGLSAKEVGQFSFAAKVVGQDVNVTERLMRGLSQAADDTSTQGEKARKMFEKLHITLKDNITGAMKPTAQILEEIGGALDELPAGVERDAAAIAMFKRAGVEAVPFLTELTQNLKIARQHGYGPTEEEITRFREYQRTLVELETNWSEFKRTMLEPLAMTFNVTVKILGKSYDAFTMPGNIVQQALFGGTPTKTDVEMGETGGYGYGTSMSRSAHAGEKRAMKLNDEQVTLARSTDEHRKLVLAQKELESLQSSLSFGVLPSINAPIIAKITAKKTEIAGIKAGIEAEAQYKADQKMVVDALRKAGEDATRKPLSGFELPAEAELRKAQEMRTIKPEQAAAFEKLYAPRIAKEQDLQNEKFQRQMLETQQTVEREKARARLGGVAGVNVRELGQGGVTRVDVEHDIVEQYEQRLDIAKQTREIEERLINERKIDSADKNAAEQKRRDLVAAAGREEVAQAEAAMAIKKEAHALAQRERDLARQHAETMSKIQLADQEETIKHDADLQRKRAQLRFKGDNPAAGIVESYRIAVTESQQLYDLETERIRLHETGFKAEEDAAIALHKLHKETLTAREEGELKLAEMQQQQLDKLKSTIEPLYHTLFTDPKNFGHQLRQTVTEAALHPITSGLSEMTATALHPLIYGAGGTGGISGTMRGIFGGGGRLNDVHLTSDGAVPVHIVNMGGGGGGGGLMPAGTNIFSTGGFGGGGWTGSGGGWGGGGGTPPFAPGPAFFNGGGGGDDAGPFGAATGGGGMPSFAQLANLPTGTPNYGAALGRLALGAALSGSSGGGTHTGLQGLAGLASSLKGSWQMALGLNKSYGSTGQMLKGMAGSPLAKAGAMTGGMMLAQAGLLGNARGTGLGVFEGALGGAGVGFAMGGPLGAAIGAGVGLGIGMGEMIAGVESPQREAKRLVQQLYHITVNSSTADQIVSIAKSSYAGHVSIAVRSPEVRHMLGLYAAGTGQASQFGAGAGEARGASLVESGGMLSQQARYQYGNAYTYSSNLPVLGGGPSLPLSPPGGGMQLSLNIGGHDAATFLRGNVVTPDVVQSQYASAMYSSSGRVGQSLLMSNPGSIAS